MRIALVSCSTLPTWEVDDRPFQTALAAAGVEVLVPAWDDAEFDWSGVEAAILRTTWDYVPRHAEFAAWIRRVAGLTRLFNPAPLVLWNLDKRYLRELAARGAPLAPTEWIAPGATSDLAALIVGRGWRTAFLKPVIGASASGTLRFTTDAAGLATAARHLATTEAPAGFMLQPYLPRVESEGERSLIFFGGAYSHAVRKVPVRGDYRVQDDYGASDGPHTPTDAEREAARLALNAMPFAEPPLYARVDLLSDESGRPVLVELEMVEPSLFFRHDPAAPARFVAAILKALA